MAPGPKRPTGRVVHTPEPSAKGGGRKAPTRQRADLPVSVRVQNKDPFAGTENYRIDTRGLRHHRIEEEDWEYTTTWEIAEAIRTVHAETVYRWCQHWFGKLPPGRQGGIRRGYRIPPEYLYVARAWAQTQEVGIRELVRWQLVDDLKDYVVVCGKVVSSHYTAGEVANRLQQLMGNSMMSQQLTTVIYVGPIEVAENGTLKVKHKKFPGLPRPNRKIVGQRTVPEDRTPISRRKVP